jgi:hypothetical protein
MNIDTIFAIIYCIFSSILTISISFYKSNEKIKIILMIFIIQISAIIHELGHLSQTKQIDNEDYIYIDYKFYIPFIGYVWSSKVITISKNIINYFMFGISGFLFQFLYLTITTLLLFNGSTLALSIVLFGFNCYLFIYAYIQYDTNTSDFMYWTKQ